jgi:hypothetical protein
VVGRCRGGWEWIPSASGFRTTQMQPARFDRFHPSHNKCGPRICPCRAGPSTIGTHTAVDTTGGAFPFLFSSSSQSSLTATGDRPKMLLGSNNLLMHASIASISMQSSIATVLRVCLALYFT